MLSRIFVPIDIYITKRKKDLIMYLKEIGIVVDKDELDVFRFKYCFFYFPIIRCKLSLDFEIEIYNTRKYLNICIIGREKCIIVHIVDSKFKYIT